MAKFTELFSEYIENGGELPAVFDQINGFKELFIGTYCDHEIGFETPVLFQIKLETKANLVTPEYKERIEAIEALKEKLLNPTKTRKKTGEIDRTYGKITSNSESTKAGSMQNKIDDTLTLELPDHKRVETDYPFNENADTATPSKITIDTASTDKHTTARTENLSYSPDYKDSTNDTTEEHTDKEIYNDYTETEEGFTSSEAEALFRTLESEVFNIKNELLKEFKNLFMLVY